MEKEEESEYNNVLKVLNGIFPYSFKVFPEETKSTILLLRPNLGAISSAPFNFKHSAWTPLSAKCFFVAIYITNV